VFWTCHREDHESYTKATVPADLAFVTHAKAESFGLGSGPSAAGPDTGLQEPCCLSKLPDRLALEH
jgi:hypothetical protein